MHFKTEEDYKAWVATQEKGAIGGGLLTPQGGEDYVGAIPAIRAVLYFKRALVMKCVKPLPYVLRIISSLPKII